MRQENDYFIQVKPIVVYPKCYIKGDVQDCLDCELQRKNICCSPFGKCMAKYPGRKNGCPNYGKKANCPPNLPPLDEIFDMEQPIYAIYTVFDLKSHADRMKVKHPNWTEKQCRCSLYWQGTAKKQMKEKSSDFMKQHKELGYVLIEAPETFGVDVTNTMKEVGVILEWPAINNVYRIHFAGILRDNIKNAEFVNQRKKYVNEKSYLIFEKLS
jgi:hypothetical protein